MTKSTLTFSEDVEPEMAVELSIGMHQFVAWVAQHQRLLAVPLRAVGMMTHLPIKIGKQLKIN